MMMMIISIFILTIKCLVFPPTTSAMPLGRQSFRPVQRRRSRRRRIQTFLRSTWDRRRNWHLPESSSRSALHQDSRIPFQRPSDLHTMPWGARWSSPLARWGIFAATRTPSGTASGPATRGYSAFDNRSTLRTRGGTPTPCWRGSRQSQNRSPVSTTRQWIFHWTDRRRERSWDRSVRYHSASPWKWSVTSPFVRETPMTAAPPVSSFRYEPYTLNSIRMFAKGWMLLRNHQTPFWRWPWRYRLLRCPLLVLPKGEKREGGRK